MNGKTRTPILLSALAVTMLGGAFASKPLYDTFCRVTGFGGTVQRADDGADRVLDRTVTVRFDANAARSAPITFGPLQRSQTVRLGENGLAFFEVENATDEPIDITATFNVTPFKAGVYFRKLECFCFTEQHLEPGERVEMPVVYFVDPELADERRLDDVHTITLSYTFFRSVGGLPDVAAANSPGAPSGGEG